MKTVSGITQLFGKTILNEIICPLFELKKFLHCKCILVNLFQNKTHYLKIFVFSKLVNLVLLVPPVVWFTIDLQIGHLKDIPCANYFFIIYYEGFLYFFRINFSKKLYFFAFWRKNQESVRKHLVKGVLL